MRSRLAFVVRRAAFSQPLGMTLAALTRRLKGHGPTQSAPKDHPIDQYYGTDTGGVISATTLRTDAPADIHNFGYVGSQPSIVRAALGKIPNLAEATFVDLGCGKGRVLLVASEHPFRRIVGVELSPLLCKIARANAARIADLYPDRTPIEVVEADALGFDLPAGPAVLYIYNPFFHKLMRAVAAKVANHAERAGHPVFLVYYNPASAPAFDRQPGLSRYFAGRFDCDDAEGAVASWRTDSVVIWQGGNSRLPPYLGADARVRVTAGGAAGEVV